MVRLNETNATFPTFILDDFTIGDITGHWSGSYNVLTSTPPYINEQIVLITLLTSWIRVIWSTTIILSIKLGLIFTSSCNWISIS